MAARPGDRRGIVTPEAVLLDFAVAGPGSRVVARIVDALAVTAILFATGLVASVLSVGEGLGWLGVVLFALLVFALAFGYPVAFETLWRGQTPGKATMGLRVVTVEGGPIRFRHAAIRAGLGVVDIYLTAGFAAIVSMVVSPLHQRLGDLAAGTLVIRERMALATGPVDARWFPPPVGFEAFTAAVEPSGLRPVDQAFARSALLRLPSLRPSGRRAALEAAEQVITSRSAVRRPPQMPLEVFVQAIVSAYQSRDAHGAPPAVRSRPTDVAASHEAAPPTDDVPPTDEAPTDGGGFAPLA